jgi:hypothetical protein
MISVDSVGGMLISANFKYYVICLVSRSGGRYGEGALNMENSTHLYCGLARTLRYAGALSIASSLSLLQTRYSYRATYATLIATK